MTHRTPLRAFATGFLPLALAVGAWLVTPVEAGPRHAKHRVVHHHGKHHGHHGAHPHRGHVRVHAGHGHHDRGPRVHGRFVIPTRIGHGHVERFRPYYHGSVYFEPHRHRHDVYDFPVWTRHGYVYRPHAYCGDTLYSDPHATHRGHVAYHGPRLSLEVGF